MLAALQALSARESVPEIRLLDVDSDPELQRRYGLKIPVLLLDQTLLCSVHLDERKLLSALARLR
jgi:Glutaredoxin-like domain (DUF836)